MSADDISAAVLGAPLELDRDAVAALAGVPEEDARLVWRAMGFPEVAAGERAFTRRDADALELTFALRDSGVVDLDTLLVLARTMGQGMARMAEAQVAAVRGAVSGLDVPQAEATLLDSLDVLPGLEQLVVAVWRRQLAAAVVRSFAAALSPDGLPLLAVGFLDLSQFTRTSRERSPAELARLLERFEAETSLRISAQSGRVVKTLGDGVLYACDDAAAAVEVALATVEAHRADDQLPDAHAGLALGPVLVRLGDVFGAPVNLASRLSDEARPGTVLVDAAAAERLAEHPAYEVTRLAARSVRGYRSLRPYVVRRAVA